MAHDVELSIPEAVRTLTRLERLEPTLRARTEGLTTMIWGLITASIFLTYQVMHVTAGHEGNMWLGLAWVPWAVAGFASTFVLWRSMHLAVGTVQEPGRRFFGFLPFLAIFLFVLAGALFAFLVLGDLGRLHEPGYMTIVLGVAASGLSVLPRPRSTRATRRVHLLVGLLAVATALTLAFAFPWPNAESRFAAQTIGGALSVGGGWFVGGFVQAAKR